MVDVSKLPTYSDAYLRELRGQVVMDIDVDRLAVAKGMIGRGRVLANRRIAEGRETRDAIDALLADRSKPEVQPEPEPEPESEPEVVETESEPVPPKRAWRRRTRDD